MSVFAEKTQIKSLTFNCSDGSYPISSLQMEAVVGNLPTCKVTVMHGKGLLGGSSKTAPTASIGDEASISFSSSGGSYTLMQGRIGAKNSSIGVGPASVAAHVTFGLMAEAAFLGGIPLGEMYFVSQQTGPVDIALQSAATMARSELYQAVDESAEYNLAKAVAAMIDRLGADGKSAGIGASLSATLNTKPCPAMTIQSPKTHNLTEQLQKEIVNVISQNPVLVTYCSIIRQFFLEIVPDFGNGSNGKLMKVMPKFPWIKQPKATLGLSDIVASSAALAGKGRNEIDGVAVRYTRTEPSVNQKCVDLSSCAVFAQSVKGGSPHIIKDYKELRRVGGCSRLLTVPIPYFVAYGMQDVLTNVDATTQEEGTKPVEVRNVDSINGWAKKWAEIMAQSTYAAVNNSGNALSIQVPFMKFLPLRQYLGYVIAVKAPWSAGANGMLENSKTERLYGLFNSWQLSINIGPDRIELAAGIGLTCVRDEKTNNALGLNESGLYEHF